MGETGEPIVALTFDDGPDARTTPKLLALLERHGARATFFLISSRVAGSEEAVAAIVRNGHELGNHFTRDEPSIRLTPGQFEAALLEADTVLSRYAPVRWARPGSGWYNGRMVATLRRHGYRCALGSVYPFDAHHPWVRFSIGYILRNVRPGSIIILHEGGARGDRTVAALSAILPALARRGYRVVSLSELMRTSAVTSS
jgi:peptidoglycan-N-acetylglucosamine deacetylase